MDETIQVLEQANKMLADMFGIDEEDKDGIEVS
jgi:hypothetical protein